MTTDPSQHNPYGQDWISSPNVIRTDKDVVIKDFFNFNNIEAYFRKGQRVVIISPSTSYQITLTDYLVAVNTSTTGPTITLPSAKSSGLGKLYVISDSTGSAAANTITIGVREGDVINNDYANLIATNYGSLKVYSSGSSSWTTF